MHVLFTLMHACNSYPNRAVTFLEQVIFNFTIMCKIFFSKLVPASVGASNDDDDDDDDVNGTTVAFIVLFAVVAVLCIILIAVIIFVVVKWKTGQKSYLEK